MSTWPGKFVIGLTGNIATGKSVVRKMLEHLGAYGIDADALAHRTIAKDSPGYQPVLRTFGTWVLGHDGQIDRTKLANLVFSNPEALRRLEMIIHPLVEQAVDLLIRRAKQRIVVVEAIKILESGMADLCDSIWIIFAPHKLQLARLIQKRNLSEASARMRIKAQPALENRTSVADIIIRNDGSFENTWRQVVAAWALVFPKEDIEALPEKEAETDEITIQRAKPREAAEIAKLINELSGGQRSLTQGDIMAAFGEKAFLFLRFGDKPLGVVGWRVENLVACTDDVYIDSSLSFIENMSSIMSEVERVSRDLQCEISLLFLREELINQEAAFMSLGYQRREVSSLGVRAWEEAAQESMDEGSIMMFKQLRQDRVMRPV